MSHLEYHHLRQKLSIICLNVLWCRRAQKSQAWQYSTTTSISHHCHVVPLDVSCRPCAAERADGNSFMESTTRHIKMGISWIQPAIAAIAAMARCQQRL
jgi:hypothetical protein